MALIKCKECGNEVSDTAKLCPKCGAKVPKSIGLVGGFFIVLGFGALIQSIAPTPIPSQPESPEQIKKKSDESTRIDKVFKYVAALKKTLNDPSSLDFESIKTDDTGNTICMSYRAKNGFGGLVKEYMVAYNGTVSSSTAVWKKRCVGKIMNDMTYFGNH